MSDPQPKQTLFSSNLDSYVISSKAPPKAIATSSEIRDRGSTFIGNIFSASSPAEAKSHIGYVKHVLHGNRPASHEIAAWRCMVLQHGKSGLGGPEDFEVTSGSMDDGEKWGGDKVLKVLQRLAIIDAVVVVSRWYGGTLLGPARFNHIETCAVEVCKAFKRSEELRESVATLETLDSLLAGLREELTTLQPAPRSSESSRDNTQSLITSEQQTEKKKQDYGSLDLVKVRRLIKARENAIKWVKDRLNEIRSDISQK